MEVHGKRDVLDVRDATVANSCFANVNMSNVKIENAQVAGMMINGISLRDLFQAYETAKTAGGN